MIDPLRGFAYFTSNRIFKLDLRNFAIVDELYGAWGRSPVADVVSGFAYFETEMGYELHSAAIAKVDLAKFSIVATLPLNPGEWVLHSAGIDERNGFAYFATATRPTVIVKIRLSDFTRVAAMIIDVTDPILFAAIDNTNGYAYFAGQRGLILKVRLSNFTLVGSLNIHNYTLTWGTISSVVIDPTNGFAYFTNSAVIKVNLSNLTVAGTLNLDRGRVHSGVIDFTKGFMYLAKEYSEIVKLDLSKFAVVRTLTLPLTYFSPSYWLETAVIDTARGYAYFVGGSNPPRVVKMSLTDLSEAGSLLLVGVDSVSSAMIDTINGYVYFVNFQRPGLVKVKLDDLSFVNSLDLSDLLYLNFNTQGHFRSGVIDALNGFAYLGTGFEIKPGKIVKVALTETMSSATSDATETAVTRLAFPSFLVVPVIAAVLVVVILLSVFRRGSRKRLD